MDCNEGAECIMTSLGEDFGLTQYSEEFIKSIINYRMQLYKNRELREYYTYEEIAGIEHCDAEDVRKILTATAIIWNH
ncbi:MAG: hypothetical protein IJ055_07075 [Oscillospiraceae bacterium]|nr:hypothetical protein [Oscillospiraceae bacterium]